MKWPVVAYALLLFAAAAASSGCGNDAAAPQKCEIAAGATTTTDFVNRLGCLGDFDALASEPLDSTLPGARSVKVVLDQFDKDKIYFQDSTKYKIHYQFASKYLSGPALPLVPSLDEFNRTQYSSSERRFILGAVTYYDGAKAWTFEIAPYDTASPAMIAKVYEAVRTSSYFGSTLFFHPTSQAVEAVAKDLPATVKIITTETLFAKIDYQPLNPGDAMGRLRFVTAAEFPTTYLSYRDIVVLGAVPNDISVTAGLISEEFQTPLSHINVLAQTRGTPNMGLRMAMSNPMLRALEGKWVQLVVGTAGFTIKEVTATEAETWWQAHKPTPVALPVLDLTVKDLRDIGAVVSETGVTLREGMLTAVKSFGAKAAGYSVLANTQGVPFRKAFAIPVFYYVQFMEQNGFFKRIDTLLADPEFVAKPEVRDAGLTKLREDMRVAPIDAAFQTLLKDKLEKDYKGLTMRFRTSTNAEDLDGFPCAGCYDSHTGDPANWDGDLLLAIRKTWATVWNLRTFEERAFHSIDHKGVAMALLVHHNFPSESANGVAVTANPFDPSGLEPGFYVNVQWGGEAEVVHPPAGVTSDEIIYQFTYPGQPAIYISHSNLVPAGQTVLSREQMYELGGALEAIHKRFMPAFGAPSGNTGWYAMDVEFKFNSDAGETPHLYVKQARPFPKRGP